MWNRAYRARVSQAGGTPLGIALERGPGSISVHRTAVLPHRGANVEWNCRYAERLLKFLLWQKGGWRVMVSGDSSLAGYLGAGYSAAGARAFDHRFLVLGRVMTGVGGGLLLSTARRVLAAEFPDLSESIRFHIPGEREKRHGQAIAAASLPAIPPKEIPNVS